MTKYKYVTFKEKHYGKSISGMQIVALNINFLSKNIPEEAFTLNH